MYSVKEEKEKFINALDKKIPSCYVNSRTGDNRCTMEKGNCECIFCKLKDKTK